MAAMWAPPVSALLLLLLQLSAPPPARATTLDKSPAANSPAAAASSALFPLKGDVYPNGVFYATILIGDPPKPYFLDVDTGSDLTWLQCNAPCRRCSKTPHPLYRPQSNRLVSCQDPLCTTVQGSQDVNKKPCTGTKQCDYEVKYADGSSSLGVLIADSFALTLANRSIVRSSLAFGCGYDQQLAGSSPAARLDGVLGLGRGAIGLLSQLKQHGIAKNVVGHCLGTKGVGYLFFGDGVVPVSRATWVPMARSASRTSYSSGSASLYFDKRSLSAKPMDVIFDSGSSYTYFATQTYQALVAALKAGLSKSLKEVADTALPLCWKGQKPFKSVFEIKDFKSLSLSFANGGKQSVLDIPPENYLIVTGSGNVCLGILDSSKNNLKELNVVGDITMQDRMVIYDNEAGQIGWFRTSCSGASKTVSFLP